MILVHRHFLISLRISYPFFFFFFLSFLPSFFRPSVRVRQERGSWVGQQLCWQNQPLKQPAPCKPKMGDQPIAELQHVFTTFSFFFFFFSKEFTLHLNDKPPDTPIALRERNLIARFALTA
jgi:hypothetical protein